MPAAQYDYLDRLTHMPESIRLTATRAHLRILHSVSDTPQYTIPASGLQNTPHDLQQQQRLTLRNLRIITADLELEPQPRFNGLSEEQARKQAMMDEHEQRVDYGTGGQLPLQQVDIFVTELLADRNRRDLGIEPRKRPQPIPGLGLGFSA